MSKSAGIEKKEEYRKQQKTTLRMLQVQISDVYTLGYQRNGCMFCGFGISAERKKCGINRFERLQKTHPNEYRWMLSQFKSQFDRCGIIY